MFYKISVSHNQWFAAVLSSRALSGVCSRGPVQPGGPLVCTEHSTR